MRIIVVGGGPAGLYFALLMKLRQPAHRITVLERNPRANTFGFGVVFSDRTLAYLAEPDPETHARLQPKLFRWDDVAVVHRGEEVRIGGNRFSGISRIDLLTVLQERCEELGVDLRFGVEIENPAEVEAVAGGPADLIVAGDGVRSGMRESRRESFAPDLDQRPNRYIWLGTAHLFDALTLTFRQAEGTSNSSGLFSSGLSSSSLFIAHSYRFSDDRSTFIVECDPASWRGAGLDRMAEDDCLRFLERVFADDLGGAPLLTNQSPWIRFVTVRCASWHDAGGDGRPPLVLLGDAAHTAHFSIGSGTKMAMEDSIALADTLDGIEPRGDSGVDGGDGGGGSELIAGLVAYEAARRPKVEELQEAAQASMEWFENAAADLHLAPVPFAFRAMTRSDRLGIESLRRRDPAFVAAAEAAGLPPVDG